MYLSSDFLFVLGSGSLLTFLVMQLPPAKGMTIPYFRNLLHCNLCTGVWIYFILVCFYHVTVGTYIPMVSEAITAAFMSFINHILLLGLKLKWGAFNE